MPVRLQLRMPLCENHALTPHACADPAFTLIVIQDPSVGTASDPSDAEGAAQRHEHAGVKPPRLGA